MKKLLMVMLALTMAVLVGCSEEETGLVITDGVTEQISVTEETQPFIPSIQQQAKRDGIPVETPYITFYYPKSWTELTAASVTENGENCTVTFRATVGQQGEKDLFALVIGPDTEQEGFFYGTLDGMNVYSLMYEYNTDGWSEEDRMELDRQQGYVNELFLQLHETPGFTQS